VCPSSPSPYGFGRTFECMITGMVLAGGSWIFLGVMIVMFFAVAFGYFTAIGSGITPRPYNKIYGGAPGAFGPGNVSGHDDRETVSWSRGTR
jgi:hypothetical protein